MGGNLRSNQTEKIALKTAVIIKRILMSIFKRKSKLYLGTKIRVGIGDCGADIDYFSLYHWFGFLNLISEES